MRRGLLAVTFAFACSSTSEGMAPSATSVELVHLVGDAGSTSTRFCVFVAKAYPSEGSCLEPRPFALFQDTAGATTHCLVKRSSDAGSTKLPTTATGGLQDLVDDPDKAAALVETALAETEEPLRARGMTLSAAAILGTSGFRDDAGNAIPGKFDPLWAAVTRPFDGRQIPIVTRTLRPEEEARFSWTTVRFLFQRNEAFSILETGGGACHFASADARAEFQDIASASHNVGTARAWQAWAADDLTLAELPTLKDPQFRVCYSGDPSNPAGQDAARCVALLKTRLFDNSPLTALAQPTLAKARSLFGMGLAWSGLFATYFPRRGSANVADIHAVAVEECGRAGQMGKNFIPHQSCFAASFQEAFLTAVGGPDAAVRNGVESWPRGASVSPGGEFPACKGASIRVPIDG